MFNIDSSIPVPNEAPRTRSGIVSDSIKHLQKNGKNGDSMIVPRPVGQVRLAINKLRVVFQELGEEFDIVAYPLPTDERGVKMTRIFKICEK